MIGLVAAGVRLVFAPLLTGVWTLLSTFIVQALLSSVFVAAGWFFRDKLFALIADAIDYIVTGLNGVGFDIPSVGEMFQALPEGVLIAMARVGLDEALAILLTAAAVRVVAGLFKWVRALNVIGGA